MTARAASTVKQHFQFATFSNVLWLFLNMEYYIILAEEEHQKNTRRTPEEHQQNTSRTQAEQEQSPSRTAGEP